LGVSIGIEKFAVPVDGSAEKVSPREDVRPPGSGSDGTCASNPVSRLIVAPFFAHPMCAAHCRRLE
jgi:hypothetical protein